MIDILSKGNPAVELSDLLRRDSVLALLLLQPLAHEIFGLLQRDRVGVIDGDWQLGDPVGHDGNARAHLPGSNHPKGFDSCEGEDRSEYHLGL